MMHLPGKGMRRIVLAGGILAVLGLFVTIGVFGPRTEPWWYVLSREGRRILGGRGDESPPEEKRIREEVILKKMQESSAQRDWRDLAPEYPRPRKPEGSDPKESLKILNDSPEAKEVERDLGEYLKKKEESFTPELPIPPLKESMDVGRLRDKGSEKVIERLLSTKERLPTEAALEENVRLGIKGPLAFRKILDRPQPPRVTVKVEAEIEMTVWVLPNGTVDRVLPSVKGDSELERIAIQYLKQWRFVPLARDQSQVEEWGTVPIKFRLQ
jgi:TonB family protein